jgi:hypothetical protein
MQYLRSAGLEAVFKKWCGEKLLFGEIRVSTKTHLENGKSYCAMWQKQDVAPQWKFEIMRSL